MGIFSRFGRKKKKSKTPDEEPEEESNTIMVTPRKPKEQQESASTTAATTDNQPRDENPAPESAPSVVSQHAPLANGASSQNHQASALHHNHATSNGAVSPPFSRAPVAQPPLHHQVVTTQPRQQTDYYPSSQQYTAHSTHIPPEERQVVRVVRDSSVSIVSQQENTPKTETEQSRSGDNTPQPREVDFGVTSTAGDEENDNDSLVLSDSESPSNHRQPTPGEQQNSKSPSSIHNNDAGISPSNRAQPRASSPSPVSDPEDDEDDVEDAQGEPLNLSYENDDEIKKLMDLSDLERQIYEGNLSPSNMTPPSEPLPSPPHQQTPQQEDEEQPKLPPQPHSPQQRGTPSRAAAQKVPAPSESLTQSQEPSMSSSADNSKPKKNSIHDMKTPRARAQIPTPTPHNNNKTEEDAESSTQPSSKSSATKSSTVLDSKNEEWSDITQKKLQHQKELEEIEAQLLEAQQEHDQMENEMRKSLDTHDQDEDDDESVSSAIEHNDEDIDLDGTRDISQILGGDSSDVNQEIFNSMAEEIDYLKSQQSAQNAQLEQYKSMMEDQQKALELWSEYQKELFHSQKEKMVESLKKELATNHEPEISVSGATPSSPSEGGSIKPRKSHVPKLAIPREISNGNTETKKKSPRRRSSSVHRSPRANGYSSAHKRTPSTSSSYAASTVSSAAKNKSARDSSVSPQRRSARLSARSNRSSRASSPRSAHTSNHKMRKAKSRNTSPRYETPTTLHSRSRSDHDATHNVRFSTSPIKNYKQKKSAPQISVHEASSTNRIGSSPDKQVMQNQDSHEAISKQNRKKSNKKRIRKRKSKKKKTANPEQPPVIPADERWRLFVNNKEKEKKKFNNRFERLYNVGVQKKKLLESWAEAERKKQLEKEILDVRPKPEISEVSRKLAERKTQEPAPQGKKKPRNHSLKDSAAWNRLYEISKAPASPKRLKDINVYEQSKLVECTFEPELSRGTNQIAWQKIQRGERELPAFEALFREAKVKNDVLNHIIQEKARAEQESLPKSRRSTLSKAQRKELFERLVNSNADRDKELESIRQHMEQEHSKGRASSAGRTRSRSTGANRRSLRGGSHIGEHLYKEGLEHLEEKKQREREHEKKMQRARSKGYVGKMSTAALNKLRDRSLRLLYEKLKGKSDKLQVSKIGPAKRKHLAQSEALKGVIPTLEQHSGNAPLDYKQFEKILKEHCDLYKISVEIKFQQRKQEVLREATQDAVFKPSLNAKSVELDKKKHNANGGSDRYLQLLQHGEEKEKRLQEKRDSLSQKELADCTFSPQVDSSYRPKRHRISLFERTFNSTRSGGSANGDDSLVEGELDLDNEFHSPYHDEVAIVTDEEYDEMILVEEDEMLQGGGGADATRAPTRRRASATRRGHVGRV